MFNKKGLLTSVLVLLLIGCSTQPILNVDNTPVAYDLQKKQVKKAIISSAIKRGWVVKKQTDSEIILGLNVRSHSAEVKIPYTEKNYSIIYTSSINLKEKNGSIHRNYNRWVNNLNVDIQRQLSVMSIGQ